MTDDGFLYVVLNGESYDFAWAVGAFANLDEAKAACGQSEYPWVEHPARDYYRGLGPYWHRRGSDPDYQTIHKVPLGALTTDPTNPGRT